MSQHITAWRDALSTEYRGETVRVTTEVIPRETRRARDLLILAALTSGKPARQIAQQHAVSQRYVRLLKARNVQNPA